MWYNIYKKIKFEVDKMRKFNITGLCVANKHYMVDISNKLTAIKKLVDEEEYFTINRGRQYGKTSTLFALEDFLKNDYNIISISFEGVGTTSFSSEDLFCQMFLNKISDYLKMSGTSEEECLKWLNNEIQSFDDLSIHIRNLCQISKKPYVLMIDEVDKTSNNTVFLNFLSKLRDKFLARAKGKDFTFHSVILAGVYDIKNIKLKLVQEGSHVLLPNETTLNNSPWNIAIDFKVDMSFSVSEIITMLDEYVKDHNTGMNKIDLAKEIYFYTTGYPVLVSRICKYIDEEIKEWTQNGVKEAVKLITTEKENPLFLAISQNLEASQDIYNLIYDVIILGARRTFSSTNPSISLAYRYGYISEKKGRVVIANKIFEIVMTDYFISKDEIKNRIITNGSWFYDITKTGKFNMEMCLQRFLIHWNELYSIKQEKFLEKECRMIFLTYLKPLLNGVGFYFIESSFTDDRRMDVVVTYGSERFIIELKTWKGELYNDAGVNQLLGYMDKYNENKGYLVTFDFRKTKDVKTPSWTTYQNKKIFEVRVGGF